MSPPQQPRRGRLVVAGLFAITMLAYMPVFRAGFIWDDDSYVTHNLTLRSLPGLWAIWTDPSATPQYYPLVHTSFWVEYHVWGAGSAVPFHLVNLLLHACSAVLLWQLLIRLEVPGAALAAALFAVHPVNVESVAWVTERKNVLSTLFYLLAFGRLLDCLPLPVRWEGGPSTSAIDRKSYALALLFFVCALLSKTVTSTLPAAVLVVVWWKRGRLRWSDVWPLLPMFAIGACAGAFTGYLERTQVGARGPEFAAITPVDRFLIAGRAVVFYAGKWVAPVRLTFIYPRWTIDPSQVWQFVFPLSVVLVLVVLWMLRRQIGLGPLAAALLFVGSLTPALGFVNVLPMRYSFVADHFMYLATLPAAAITGAILQRAIRSPVPHQLLCGAVLALLTTLTFCRSLAYANSMTLWRDTLTKNPGSWMVHENLGHALAAAGDNEGAFEQYGQALALAPQLPEPHLTVGLGEAMHGNISAAADQFRRAIAIDPSYAPAYGFLSKALLQLGQTAEAEMWARRGVALANGMSQPHVALAQALQVQGRYAEAIEQDELAVHAEPDRADLRAELAAARQAYAEHSP